MKLRGKRWQCRNTLVGGCGMLGNQDRKNSEIFITEIWRLILQNYIHRMTEP